MGAIKSKIKVEDDDMEVSASEPTEKEEGVQKEESRIVIHYKKHPSEQVMDVPQNFKGLYEVIKGLVEVQPSDTDFIEVTLRRSSLITEEEKPVVIAKVRYEVCPEDSKILFKAHIKDMQELSANIETCDEISEETQAEIQLFIDTIGALSEYQETADMAVSGLKDFLKNLVATNKKESYKRFIDTLLESPQCKDIVTELLWTKG